jgi:gliding motility-associated-like protein
MMSKFFRICIVSVLLHFIFPDKMFAQLCQGSLGDPVVNITFGSGSNPGPPLVNTTNYTYIASDCPNDGYYTIANSTSNCFGGTWHSVPQDHTPGDINGYMMVVNASYNPGDFFVKTVDGLCPNTTYEFAAWIYNLLLPTACGGNGIKPNITFNIETTSGTVLQSYKTGDIPMTPNWTQYGFYFSTTAGISSVVLRMTNNAPGGCGNDLLLDDITFRACGPLVSANLVGAADSANVCTGDTSVFTLTANVSAGYNDPLYQWQLSTGSDATWTNIPGANNTTYVRPAVLTPGIYLYRLAVSEQANSNISSCSIFSNLISLSVNKYPLPAASYRGNCTSDTLFLSATDGTVFSWSGPLGFSSNDQFPFIANATPSNSGTYLVQVTSEKDCTSNDSTIVQINDKPDVKAGNDAEICGGTSAQLQATGTNITSYVWSPAASLSNPFISDPVARPIFTTSYTVTVANYYCRVSDSVLITVNQNPYANAGSDKVIISGQSVVLNGFAGGTDVSFKWTPDEYITSENTLNPVVNPPANQKYILLVISNVGCGTASDTVLVKVFEKLFIPNAFTPNGDGINDAWVIETLQAYPNAELKVFNRLGQMVFDNHGQNTAWDGKYKGKMVSPGAYVYTIDLKNNTEIIKGVVYVVL